MLVKKATTPLSLAAIACEFIWPEWLLGKRHPSLPLYGANRPKLSVVIESHYFCSGPWYMTQMVFSSLAVPFLLHKC